VDTNDALRRTLIASGIRRVAEIESGYPVQQFLDLIASVV